MNITIAVPGVTSSHRRLPGILASIFLTIFTTHANAATIDDLLAAHNSYRASHGAPALCFNSKLLTAASNFCSYMASTGDFSHYSRNGGTPETRLQDVGYNWYTYGENIAWGYGSVASVMSGWESSPGHNENILNSNFRQAGLAACQSSTGTVWVAIFGASNTESCTGSSTATTTTQTTTSTTTNNLSTNNNALSILGAQPDGWIYLYQSELWPPILQGNTVVGWNNPLPSITVNSANGWCYIARGHLYKYSAGRFTLLM